MRDIRWLSEEIDRQKFGNKAYYLSRLNKLGFSIPRGFVISFNALKNIDSIKREIVEFANKLGVNYFSVRSSSMYEDTHNQSKAGEFLSLVKVPKEKLVEAVERVANTRDGPISVIVHEYIEGVNGVGFSRNPTNPNYVLLEFSTNGSPTEGNVDARYNIKRDNIEYKIRELFSEDFLSYEYEKLAEVIASDLLKMEAELGFDRGVDAEFVVTNKGVFYLQARPITKLYPVKKSENIEILVPGKFAGKLLMNPTERDLQQADEKVVVAVERLEYWLKDYLERIAGIIVEKPAITSHLAIQLREKQIPTIVYPLSKLVGKTYVKFDGTKLD